MQINLQTKKESFDSLSKLSLYLFLHGETMFLISKVYTLVSLIISVRKQPSSKREGKTRGHPQGLFILNR